MEAALLWTLVVDVLWGGQCSPAGLLSSLHLQCLWSRAELPLDHAVLLSTAVEVAEDLCW